MPGDMINMAVAFEECAGEPITHAVLGSESSWSDDPDYGLTYFKPTIPMEQRGKLLSWEEARPWLDHEYYSGFGGEDCYALTAWSKNWVLFVACYDGSTWVTKVPRRPKAHQPCHIGGG